MTDEWFVVQRRKRAPGTRAHPHYLAVVARGLRPPQRRDGRSCLDPGDPIDASATRS